MSLFDLLRRRAQKGPSVLHHKDDETRILHRSENPKSAAVLEAVRNSVRLDEADLSGVSLIGQRLEGAMLARTNMRDANLHGCLVRSSDLSGADLSGAYMQSTNLFQTNLEGAIVKGAHMRSLNARHAILRNIDFSGVSLAMSNLTEADLTGCTFDKTDFRMVTTRGTRFSIDADFSTALRNPNSFAGAVFVDDQGNEITAHVGKDGRVVRGPNPNTPRP